MSIYDKIRAFCQPFRIVLGTVVLALGFYFTDENSFYNVWFGFGIIPLIAGITGFCPLCMITKKCSIK